MPTLQTEPAIESIASMYPVETGHAHPLGAIPDAGGVNFSLFSEYAVAIELLLFDQCAATQPFQVISLDATLNKTFHFWHVYVKGLKPGAHYAYRADGAWNLQQGHRFNHNKVLLDPYAKANTNTVWQRADAVGDADNVATSMRSVVVDLNDYDWQGDRPLKHPMKDSIIYEMHVAGFTRSPTSGCTHSGTFSGVIEKIPYLKELGITAVELMPICDFDEKNVLRETNGVVLKDYWGYNPHSYFAPEASYCVSPSVGTHIQEFRDMVKALHQAGIEVILDVVFNHTDEGNHQGPTVNFRGFDNSLYYHLVPSDRQFYMDYSGCGNTFNCNHPIAEKLILECLEFWVKEMHVDGFRFDEGSILARGQDGTPLAYPPVIWHIEISDILADTKIIAEAWDAAGLYQIGYFPGYRWAEWNGRYRDDVRRFVKGDPGLIGEVASRIAGSADLYQSTGHLPINSVNFITCHDGFTLNDLVSYDGKHNEANGEDNRDGSNDNLSWNCGAEGETDDAAIESLRQRQIKNFVTILMLSQGVPMITMGDEVRRSQQGNNNGYCQNNEISWFDWNLVEQNADILRFFQRLIQFRKSHSVLRRGRFFTGEINDRGLADITWHGTQLHAPGWEDQSARTFAFTLGGSGSDPDIHVMLNLYWENLKFELPPIAVGQSPAGHRRWYKVVDTAEQTPADAVEPGQEILIMEPAYEVKDRSVVVLLSK